MAAEPREARGGIIADDMGLGKSLVILSAIANTLSDAAEFTSAWKHDSATLSNSQTPSRATLILVPSTSNDTLAQIWQFSSIDC
jgi:SWI/SNF-related matrix-associated actin-dependent regulator of chromatin subfamily A3